MTREQFSATLAIARSDKDLSAFDDEILHGCGLPGFERVSVVIEVAAKLLRWQCVTLAGGIDNEELERMRETFRTKVLIV